MARSGSPGRYSDQGREPSLVALGGRTARAARCRAPGAVPHLQRGLHRQLGSGAAPGRAGREAIRLTRQLQRSTDGEVAGLPARRPTYRRPARTRPDGTLVPLAEQDRTRWDPEAIAKVVALITRTPASAPIGPYQAQAAIAAVHDEAATCQDTDWEQILALYEHLHRLAPGLMVELNRIVAVAMVHGPETVFRQLEPAEADLALTGHHRLDAVRAHRSSPRRGGGMGRLPPGRPPHLSLLERGISSRARPGFLRPSLLIGRSSNTGWPWPRRRSA